MKDFKKGDSVQIKDGSYMLNKSTLENYGTGSTKVIGWNREVWDVIKTGKVLVFTDDSVELDTLIKNTVNGEEWLCNAKINLKPASDKKEPIPKTWLFTCTPILFDVPDSFGNVISKDCIINTDKLNKMKKTFTLKTLDSIKQTEKGYEISGEVEEEITEVEEIKDNLKKDPISGKYVNAEEHKQVELVRGEVYVCEDGEKLEIFRHNPSEWLNSTRIDYYSLLKINKSKINTDFIQNRFIQGIDYIKSLCPATEEEKAKLIKAEEQHGLYWDDGKKDFLKLEEVYCKLDDLSDLLNIYSIRADFVCEGSTLRMKYCYIGFSEGNFERYYEPMTNRKLVNKETFINILKHRKL